MAKMKIEFTAPVQGNARPHAARPLIAQLPRSGRRAAAGCRGLPICAIACRRRAGCRKLARLSARAALPRWRATPSCAPTLGLAARRTARGSREDVVLFVDTFNGYFEPKTRVPRARAAGRRLSRARAAWPTTPARRPLCCGRTFLAPGMVDEAKAEARGVARRAAAARARGVAIVGLEPSCLLTLRDEFLVMGLGEAARDGRGRTRCLFEEFLARELQPAGSRWTLKPAAAAQAHPAARPLPPEGVRRGAACSRCCADPGLEP
jgi:Fe-S oxidoreductase